MRKRMQLIPFGSPERTFFAYKYMKDVDLELIRNNIQYRLVDKLKPLKKVLYG